MRLRTRLLSLIAASVIFCGLPEVCMADGYINVSQGRSIVYSGGKYTLDLGRAYPIDNITVSGTDISGASVTASTDADFAPESVGSESNISKGKPVSSKLYGRGGYSTFVSANANDGNDSTLFIATPVSYTDIEWLTVDLGDAHTVSRATVNATTERSYDIYLTNCYYEKTEEFSEYIKMEPRDGSYYVPEQYKYDKFHYARLVFNAASGSSGKDIRLYEFSVFSNDGDFSLNLAKGKPISTKLYGSGGYGTYVAANANDGNSSTLFIATPVRYTDVEWLTVDLGSRCTVGRAEVTATTERSYDVYLTNVNYGQVQEYQEYVKMDKRNGKFYMPAGHQNETYRYARLVFNAASGSSGKDIRLYEFSIFPNEEDISGYITERSTTVLERSGVAFVPNGYAKNRYYRYIKVTGASGVSEINVFSPAQAAEYENIASDAELSMPSNAVIYGSCYLSNAIDGNYFSITALSHSNPYVQLDLKKAYDISHTEVYFRQDLGSDRENVRVLASNDPEFNVFSELDAQMKNETFGSKGALVSVNKSRFENYRYIRVYEGKSKSFLVLGEIRVFAKDGHGDPGNTAQGKIPQTDDNPETAYRITDGDIKSFWEGGSVTVDLGYCRKTDMAEITGSGDIEVTFLCDGDAEEPIELSLEKDVPKAVAVNKKIRYINIESSNGSEIRINEVKASSENGADRLVKADYVKTQNNGEYVYDLGKNLIIDHIEPCDAEAYISSESDFNHEKELIMHSDGPVSGRYIRSAYDIEVYTYSSPKILTDNNGRTLRYDAGQYLSNGGNTAICAQYDPNGRLLSATADSQKEGELVLSGDNGCGSAKLMLWDNMENIRPVMPAANVVFEDNRPWKEIYVSQGAVNGDGTENAPFGTLDEAKNYIRTVNGGMQGDIYVYIREGRYILNEPLVFGPADSGKNGYNIIYKNYEGENPEISGGRVLPAFEQGANGLWQTYAPQMSEIYGLLVNGRPAVLSHTETPVTADEIYSSGTYSYAGLAFSSDKIPLLSNGSCVFVRAVKSWIDNSFRASSVSPSNGQIRININSGNFNLACSTSVHPLTADSEYTIENAFELLDNPGEFYFNQSTKMLYYMPREGENINLSVAEAAYLDSLIEIRGTGAGNKACNISFSGLKFENATYHDVYRGGFRVAQAELAVIGTAEAHGKYYSRFFDGTIHIAYADNIDISGCEVANVTKCGISLEQGVTNTNISSNRIYNTGDSAVSCGRPWHEYATNELCEKNKVYDNIIYDTGKYNRSAPAIAFYYVRDCEIVHNSITDASYSAISLGWGWNNYPDSVVCRRNRVADNYIHNFNLQASDGGAVYTLGQQSGTVIDGNYIVMDKAPHQTYGTVAIYPDEGSKFMNIRNNVIDVNINLEGNVYTISLWQSSIGYNFVHSNYATADKIRDNSTETFFEGVYLYDRDSIPEKVQDIMKKSAASLNN